MDTILVQIFFMMAFTFAVGFAVAAVIKLIAVEAERFNFSHSHAQELKRLKSIRKFQSARLMRMTHPSRAFRGEMPSSEEEEYKLGESIVSGNYYPRQSRGFSEFDIMDYYYPDEKIEIMEKMEDKKK